MKVNKWILLEFFILWGFMVGYSQNITFNHLTTREGLSHYSAMALYQDERGYIWMGTRNGLNVYNGNRITQYKNKKNDPSTIFQKTIRNITGDKNGNVFLQNTKGIAVYDIKKDRFTTLIQNNFTVIFYQKYLYAAKDNEVYVYNGKEFKLHYKLPDDRAKIVSLHLSGDSIFMGTENKGLYLLRAKKHLMRVIKDVNVTAISKDKQGGYWIGSWEAGLFHYQSGKLKNYRSIVGDKNTISSNFVRTTCEDRQGRIWVGTINGINCYDPRSDKFNCYTKGAGNDGPSHSSIWSLLCDHQGNVWAGTYFGGVSYFNPENSIYRHYKESTQESRGLSNSVVGKMLEDEENNLWVATEGGGLNRYNRETGEFKWYQSGNTPNSISHSNIKAVYYEKQNKVLWIGTHLGGLNKLDIKTGHISRFPFLSEGLITSSIVCDIEPYGDKLIIATHNGVFLFDTKTNKYHNLFKDIPEGDPIGFALDVLVDSRDVLWIAGSGEGLYAYNLKTRKLTNYKKNYALQHSLSSNSVNCIFEDDQKRIWLCAESGLDLYRQETDDFDNFDEINNGLASDCVYGICQTGRDNYVLITDNGLSRFNFKTKQFTNYNHNSGFPLSAINQYAIYKAKDGEIFVGGIDGMVSFFEKDLDKPIQPYSIMPFRLSVNGEEVTVDDVTGILSQSLSETLEITLSASQSMFSIEYAATNYLHAQKSNLQYRLEGFSDIWTDVRGQVTYTNLNPGKYTLVVRATGLSSKHIPESRLDIVILPPFYRTFWAYMLYIIGTMALFYFLFRMYKNKIKLEESLKYERKHTQDIEALNQSKLRFFTNISHEFRTPLTLIVGQVEMLLQQRSHLPGMYNRILSVYKNSLQLRELITELLDFRKQEQGHMTIKVSEYNLVDFLSENYALFQEYALARNIRFRWGKSTDSLPVWYDAKQMQKVVNNLLSNAFKYTPEGGEIKLLVRKEGDNAVWEVSDNGNGIAPEEVKKIFDRFYQTNQLDSIANMGTGIGLSLTKGIVELHSGTIEVSSHLGVGSSFVVKLPLGNNHFTSDQIDDSCGHPYLVIENTEALNIEEIDGDSILDLDEPVTPSDYTVLVVEDNDHLREMLVNIFEPYYRVMTASNGKEGLTMTRNNTFHLIVSDVVMPEMSGTELCKVLKNDMDTCHIPVVLLTARTAIEYNVEGLRIGADDYITKPFNVNILLSRCSNLINNRLLLQEKFSKQPQVSHKVLATNRLDKEFVDKAIAVIEKYIADPELNVDLFAREMGIARTKLFNKLKEVAGQTPFDFIMTVRLKKAAVLLKTNFEMNISEISDQLGFSSPRYFSKCFKEKYNVVPQTYRKDE